MSDLELRAAAISHEQIEAVPVLRAAALPIERRYGIAEVRCRLHQQRFRAAVIAAYDARCAICRLRHPELLDAADAEDRPDPVLLERRWKKFAA